MNRFLKNSIMGWAAAICLLPATGSANTVIFTLSSSLPFQVNGSSVTGSGSTEVVNILYSDLNISMNGGAPVDHSGTYTETYTNSTGLLTLTGTGGISMTVTEAMNLVGTFTGNSANLYSGVTAVTFNAAFQTLLGLAGNPPLSQIGPENFSVTANGGQVTSAIGTMTVGTPEPSSFVMLGIALLSGIGFKVRRQSGLSLFGKKTLS